MPSDVIDAIVTELERADWCLPMGETLDNVRARASLARFGPEVKRHGQEFAARVRAKQPGHAVEGTVFGVPALLDASNCCRS